MMGHTHTANSANAVTLIFTGLPQRLPPRSARDNTTQHLIATAADAAAGSGRHSAKMTSPIRKRLHQHPGGRVGHRHRGTGHRAGTALPLMANADRPGPWQRIR